MLRKGQRRRLPRRRQSKHSVRNKNGENRNVRFYIGRHFIVWGNVPNFIVWGNVKLYIRGSRMRGSNTGVQGI